MITLHRSVAACAPRLQELAVLREFHDAIIWILAVALSDENLASCIGDDIVWLPAAFGRTRRSTWLANGHEQFAFGAELEHLMT